MTRLKVKSNVVSDDLLNLLAGHEQVLIVMHDNPDPDAIASAWALQTLLDVRLQIPSRLVAGGAIVRAENRHMVDLLGAPIQLVMNIEGSHETPVVLVDCGSKSSNHLLDQSGMHPLVIIDHHIDSCEGKGPVFVDLRPDVAATATIAASYLCEQKVEPGAKLATALLYAIRTETRGSETSYSPLDNEMVVWLTERAEPELLAEIESAPLSVGWYSDLVLAMQCTTLFGDVAVCFLPRTEGPEIVGEVADLLIRGDRIRRVLCAAVVGRDVLISVRTAKDDGDACRLAVETIGDLGGAGGHMCRAGGKIPDAACDGKVSDTLEQQIRARWLKLCGASDRTPMQLISWRDVVEHI